MLKIGIIGVGHFGKIHIKCIQNIKYLQLVGFYDIDNNTSCLVEDEFKIRRFNSMEELVANVDIVDIVTPTLSHFECASYAIKNYKHVFIEKPLTANIEEGRALINLSHEAGVKIQVGHVERYNPAFLAAKPYINNPLFIESHRLSQFNHKNIGVSVVLDLMIHDIDIILSTVKSQVRKINANGISIISETPDIANARLEFTNGSVANITASRFSMNTMRKTRVFQKNSYISIDFLKKETEIYRFTNTISSPHQILDIKLPIKDKSIEIEKPTILSINAVQCEIEDFAESIVSDKNPTVCIEDGYSALDIAYQIDEKIKSANKLLLD